MACRFDLTRSFGVTDDAFLHRIPDDLVAGAQRDVAEVRDTGDVLANFQVFQGC